MHGNVWEWCQDWYGKDYYINSSRLDPKGPASGDSRVLRGGSWYHYARFCRSALRGRGGPGDRSDRFGFRLACSEEVVGGAAALKKAEDERRAREESARKTPIKTENKGGSSVINGDDDLNQLLEDLEAVDKKNKKVNFCRHCGLSLKHLQPTPSKCSFCEKSLLRK